MNKFCFIVLLVLIFVQDVRGNVQSYTEVPKTEILSAQFGLFNPPESGKAFFIPTKSVPYIEHQGYGWIIVIKSSKPKVRWREEFTLPSSPKTWGEGNAKCINSISHDRRTSIIECEEKFASGIISHSWSVAPGDPRGHYIIRVIVDGTEERSFEFDVQ